MDDLLLALNFSQRQQVRESLGCLIYNLQQKGHRTLGICPIRIEDPSCKDNGDAIIRFKDEDSKIRFILKYL